MTVPILCLVLLLLLATIFTPVMFNPSKASADHLPTVLSIKDNKEVSFHGMVRDLSGSDVIMFGEVHILPEHKSMAASVLDALRKQGVSIALGLEMFPASAQPGLNQWVQKEINEKEFRNLYENLWSTPYDVYRGLFIYARKAGIPLIGLNAPHEIVKKVAKEGFDSLTDDDLKKLPVGITCNVDPEYRAFIKDMLGSHAGKGESGLAFERFCEAQLLWDNVMAWYVADYIKNHPETKMLVLTGIIHAWKKGIPHALETEHGLKVKVLLPYIDEKMKIRLTPELLDYLLVPNTINTTP
jgi:uncharacterized iron-regulated protein